MEAEGNGEYEDCKSLQVAPQSLSVRYFKWRSSHPRQKDPICVWTLESQLVCARTHAWLTQLKSPESSQCLHQKEDSSAFNASTNIGFTCNMNPQWSIDVVGRSFLSESGKPTSVSFQQSAPLNRRASHVINCSVQVAKLPSTGCNSQVKNCFL